MCGCEGAVCGQNWVAWGSRLSRFMIVIVLSDKLVALMLLNKVCGWVCCVAVAVGRVVRLGRIQD